MLKSKDLKANRGGWEGAKGEESGDDLVANMERVLAQVTL